MFSISKPGMVDISQRKDKKRWERGERERERAKWVREYYLVGGYHRLSGNSKKLVWYNLLLGIIEEPLWVLCQSYHRRGKWGGGFERMNKQ